jgi:hypothetical protein
MNLETVVQEQNFGPPNDIMGGYGGTGSFFSEVSTVVIHLPTLLFKTRMMNLHRVMKKEMAISGW